MATYISLLRFTQQGIENIKDSPNRLEVAMLSFIVGGQGAVRTETLRAFGEGEYKEIVAALP